MTSRTNPLVFRGLEAVVGDVVRVRAPGVSNGELATIESKDGTSSMARVIELDGERATLQVFDGTRGLSTGATVRFLGAPLRARFSEHVLGRVFDGAGEPMDGGPHLRAAPEIPVAGPSVNPTWRRLPHRMIRTDIPMIDVFNSLVESQKISIFSVPGEPYDALLARVGFQADADIVVFGGMGLGFDDFHVFRSAFEDRGTLSRTVMFVNLASDPVVERLLVPDLALAVAEAFAIQGRRVLVLLTDMTAYADALKEVAITMERIPSNRGYLGDLYSRLAQRYEKACQFRDAGSVTILSVTTMPGHDITHPVPDNTGYITEGQYYLHGGLLDPFGSLSRLKQHVVDKMTREDHGQLATAMIRLYAAAEDAERKRAMAFDLSSFDRQLLRYRALFRDRFMSIDRTVPLEAALDLGWSTLAECFDPSQILVKSALRDKYLPQRGAAA